MDIAGVKEATLGWPEAFLLQYQMDTMQQAKMLMALYFTTR
jgi:uncharacterized membrane protein